MSHPHFAFQAASLFFCNFELPNVVQYTVRQLTVITEIGVNQRIVVEDAIYIGKEELRN